MSRGCSAVMVLGLVCLAGCGGTATHTNSTSTACKGYPPKGPLNGWTAYAAGTLTRKILCQDLGRPTSIRTDDQGREVWTYTQGQRFTLRGERVVIDQEPGQPPQDASAAPRAPQPSGRLALGGLSPEAASDLQQVLSKAGCSRSKILRAARRPNLPPPEREMLLRFATAMPPHASTCATLTNTLPLRSSG